MSRIIGIDFGLSKVGIAISDPSGIISMPLETIRYKNQKELIEVIKKIALEKNVKTLVIGYPLNMNFKENNMTEIIDKFKIVMENNNFAIHLEDERLSTFSVDASIRVSCNTSLLPSASDASFVLSGEEVNFATDAALAAIISEDEHGDGLSTKLT